MGDTDSSVLLNFAVVERRDEVERRAKVHNVYCITCIRRATDVASRAMHLGSTAEKQQVLLLADACARAI